MTLVATIRGRGPRVTVNRSGSGGYEVLGVPETSPIFAHRSDAEKWLKAKVALLPKSHLPQVRRCLCCNGEFKSEGFHHRMCATCRQFGSDVAGMAATISGTRLRRVTR